MMLLDKDKQLNINIINIYVVGDGMVTAIMVEGRGKFQPIL